MNRTCTGTTTCSTDFVTCQLRRFDKNIFETFFKQIEVGIFDMNLERIKLESSVLSWKVIDQVGKLLSNLERINEVEKLLYRS